MTSHDVVIAARRATGQRRIGHGGTLDPFATGLLVLLVGRATRLLSHIHADPKVYEASIVFAAETDTDDAGGETIREAELPSRDAVLAAIPGLTGDILQMPPAYSAKRVGGRRAYAVARSGKAPALEPVRVRVDSWESLAWHGTPEAASAWDVRITCGGGTYIRALARDLGRAVGSAAHLRSLRRVRSGVFDVADAVSVRDLLEGRAELRSPLAALPHLPHIPIDHDVVARVVRGIAIPASSDAMPGVATSEDTQPSWAALVAADTGVLVALAEFRAGSWHPRVVMRPAIDVPLAGRPS